MNKVKFFYAIVCGAFLVACSEEENGMPTDRTGIRVALTEKAGVETRNTPEELPKPVAKDFHLKITDAAGKPVYDAGYTPELIPASVGTYTLEATYGGNPELALDDPYYKGEAEAEVTEGEPEKVTISCTVANALASAVFNDEGVYRFGDQFSSYGIKVEVGASSTTLTTTGESAYYRADSRPTFTFTGTLKEGGEEIEVPLANDKFSQAETFAAGTHCVITLKLTASNPGVRVEVSKVEVKDVTIDETIPMEWLPKPKVEAEGFDANNALSFVETESKAAKLNLNLSSALQDIRLKFNFQDPQFASLNAQEEYLLSKDKATLESTLGITLPNIGDAAASIDLSALIDRLQTHAGTPTTNTLSIDVQANNRWSSEDTSKNLTYTLTCNKPEFSVAVQEGNCWSREFTIDEVTVSGNANPDKIKSNLKYQYYNGTDWVDCTTRDNVVGRTQQFAEAAEGITTKTYQVRALYRDVIASEVVNATLETPQQLPNSGMEEWSETEDDTGLWGHSYRTFYPYSSGTSDIWWTTNNERSQDGVKAGRLSYKGSFAPCVSYNEGIKHSGTRSALIYTSGHGGGYASTGAIIYTESAFAGSLFIGKYHWTGDSEEIETGHSFAVRPSNLKFYYKYRPKNSDAFRVYVELKNGNEIIASGTYIPETIYSETDWIEGNVILNYVDVPKVATSIYVQFLSTTKTSFAESDFNKNMSITFPNMNNWNAHVGSMLYIDDISLVYDK